MEVRVHKWGQVSLRPTLPRDGMGSILDHDTLPQQVTSLLRFTGALELIPHERIIVAVGMSEPKLTQVGRFHPHELRRRAELGAYISSFTLRTEPDESVSLAAPGTGAEEVTRVLSRALIKQHPSSA